MSTLNTLLNSGVQFAIPLLLAAIGELVAQRSGVVNIGIEGYMAAGAYTAFLMIHEGGGVTAALAVAALSGLASSAVMVVGSVLLKANQILVGFALFVLVPNLTAFFFIQSKNQGSVTPMAQHSVPFLGNLPLLGPMLFRQSYLFYLALVAAGLVAVFFARTRGGLNVIAVGHDPVAARTRGIRPVRVQAMAVLFCGLMSGLGGAALSIGSVGNFTPGIIDGRGLIVVATVILGRWTVTGVLTGSILIGVLTAAQLVYSDSTFIPIQVFGALPWAIVLIALLVSLRWRSNDPRSL